MNMRRRRTVATTAYNIKWSWGALWSAVLLLISGGTILDRGGRQTGYGYWFTATGIQAASGAATIEVKSPKGLNPGFTDPWALTYQLSENADPNEDLFFRFGPALGNPFLPQVVVINQSATDINGNLLGSGGVEHTIYLRKFSTLADDMVEILSVTPTDDSIAPFNIPHQSPNGVLMNVIAGYTGDLSGPSPTQTNPYLYLWTYDSVTETPVVTEPLPESSFPVNFDLVYSFPGNRDEALFESLKLTIVPLNPADDPHGDRVITFSKTSEGSINNFKPLSQLPGGMTDVSSINTPQDLIPGALYNFTLSYQDQLGNAQASTTVPNLRHDVLTEPIVMLLPSASPGQEATRIPVAFTSRFTIPEDAHTVELMIYPLQKDPDCPEDLGAQGACGVDSLQRRRIIFGAAFKVAGTHEFTSPSSGISSLQAADPNVTIVECVDDASCNPDLVHGFVYSFTYQYKDVIENECSTGGSFCTDAVLVSFDTQTFAPTLSAPEADTRVLDGFSLTFELAEQALSGSVKAIFTLAGDSEEADPNSPHIVTFSSAFETKEEHSVSITALTNLVASEAKVVDVTSNGGASQPLVNGAKYEVIVSYQDIAGNPASASATRFFIFDSATIPPTLQAPTAQTSIDSDFTVQFTIPEEMADGTCTLTIKEIGGAVDDPVPNARVLRLTTAVHSAGSYSGTLRSAQLSSNPVASPLSDWVESVSSRFPLTDGTIYNFTIGCEDFAGNTFQSTTVPDVLFAGSSTIAPIFTSPASAGCLREDAGTGFEFTPRKCEGGASAADPYTEDEDGTLCLANGGDYTENICPGGDATSRASCIGRAVFEFTLLEPPQAGSVEITLTPSSGCGSITDPNGPRILVLGGISTSGTYKVALSAPLSGIVAAEALVTQVGGAGLTNSLVDGMAYNVQLSYQDSVGNPVASVVANSVSFSGTETITPTLTRPLDGAALGLTYLLEFILPEPALADTVKITFARSSGRPDNANPRVIQFSGEVETCATHQVAIGGAGISAASDLSAVTSVTPSVDLVDGAVYNVTLEYQDCGGHTKRVAADRSIDYSGISTLAPTLTSPGSVSSIAEDFHVEFTLPEAACPGSIYLTFISSGGLVQDAFSGIRTVKLGNSVESRGTHTFQMTWFRDAVAYIDAVSAIECSDDTPCSDDEIDLIHGRKYLVDLFYQDAVCNPEQSAGSIEVTFASNFTLLPFFYSPLPEATLASSFKVKFTLVEAGSADSVRLSFSPSTPSSNPPPDVCGYGVDDTASGVRNLTFSDYSEGTRDLSIRGAFSLGTAAAVDAGTLSNVAPLTDLIDGSCYTLTLSYEDGGGNPAVFVEHSNIRYVGDATIALEAFGPAPGSSIRTDFPLEFTLPEPAQSGSLVVTIASLNTEIDGNDPREIVLTGDMLFAGPHTLTFRLIADITTDVNVFSCNGVQSIGGSCANLEHTGTYSINLAYRDAAGNPTASKLQQIYTYDIFTETPSLTGPASDSFIRTNFTAAFRLAEPGLAGSVSLTMTPLITSIIPDSHDPRVIVLEDVYSSVTDANTATMSALSTANISNAAVASVTPPLDLVDGASYDLTLSYQDAAGNDEATASLTALTFCGSTTLTPEFIAPLANRTFTTSKTVTFRLPEKAFGGTVKLTFRHVGHGPFGEAMNGVADADEFGDRVVVFSSSGFSDLSIPAIAHSCALVALDQPQDDCVEEVRNPRPLVDGEIYEAILSYQDMVQNPPAEVFVPGIEHDLTTQSPTLIVPPSSANIRIKVAFLLKVNLPEAATEDSLQLRIDPTDPSGDPHGARTISFSRELAGDYNVTLEGLSTAADNVVGISDIDTKIDLVHLQTYIFRLQYQDILRNAPATDFTGTITFDNATAQPSIHFPQVDGTFREDFSLDYTIPEEAQVGTVTLTITPTGRIAPGSEYHTTSTDAAGVRTISLNTLAKRPTYPDGNRYLILMQDLATLVTARAEVDSISVENTGQAASLLHLNSYDLVLSFKDTADNDAASHLVSNVTFDVFTISPVLHYPATGDFIITDFTVDFSLLELAEGGSVTLTISYAGSTLPRSTPADTEARVITFAADEVYRLSRYSLTLAQLSTLADTGFTYTPSSCSGDASYNANQTACVDKGHIFTVATCRDDSNQDQGGAKRASSLENCIGKPFVSSVLPQVTFNDRVEAADLTDGSMYDFTLSMKDAAGNIAATHSQNGVHFVGSSTIPAVVNSPPSDSHIPDLWTLDIVLYEQMANCSLIIQLNTAPKDGRIEPVTRRTINFEPSSLTPGPHQYTMQNISSLPDSMNEVSSVTNAYDLKVGAVYDMSFVCTDMAPGSVNPSATTTVTGVEYAGEATLVPVFVQPAASSSQRNTFPIRFTLPESAFADSVKLILLPQPRLTGVNDTLGVRIVTFSSLFETSGTHSGTMDDLSSSNQLAYVDNVVPPLGKSSTLS